MKQKEMLRENSQNPPAKAGGGVLQITAASSGVSAYYEFFTLDCVTQDEKGNIIIKKDY